MSTKKIYTLYAYDIKQKKETRGTSDLRDKLIKLQEDKDKNTIGKRKLKNDNFDEYDVLLYYDINNATQRFFGVMVEFEAKTIPPQKFNQICVEEWNKIQNEDKAKDIVNTIEIESTNEIIFKDLYFFMVDKTHLVISIPLIRIHEFEKYLNWLLGDYESTIYSFELILHTTNGVKISEPNKGMADNSIISIIQPKKRTLRKKDDIIELIRSSTEDRPIDIKDETKMVKDLFKTKELSVDTNNLSRDIVELLRKKMNEFLTELK